MEGSPASFSAWTTLAESISPSTLEKLVRVSIAQLTGAAATRTGGLTLTDAFRPSKEKDAGHLPLSRGAAQGVLSTVNFLTAALIAAAGTHPSSSALGKSLRKLFAEVDWETEPNQSLCNAILAAFDRVAESTLALSSASHAPLPLSLLYNESQHSTSSASNVHLVAVLPITAYPDAPTGALRHEVMVPMR